MLQNPQAKDERMSLDELFEKVRETSLRIPRPETPSAVLFTGQTQDGKSTLLAYLKDSQALKAAEDENDEQGRLAFVSNDPENDLGIGQGLSETTIPTNHEIYWDLPGIAKDTRGPDQDILNAWSIRSLCMHIERIKIVFVVSEENLKYLRLIEIAKAVTEVFPNIDQNLSSLCMVITKKQNTSVVKFREVLRRGLAKENQNLDPIVYNLLEFFSQEGPIVSFSRPTDEGPAQDNEREAIIETINGVTWYEKPKIGRGISPDSKYILLKLRNAEFDSFSLFIAENFEQVLNKYLNEMRNLHAGSIGNLRLVLKALWSSLNALNTNPLELQDCLNKLENLSLQMNDGKLKDFVLNKQKSFKFLAQLESDPSKVTARNVTASFSWLNSFLKDLLTLQERPQIQEKNVILTLKGRIISSEDINKALSQYSDISEVDVSSSDMIFINDNIRFSGGRLSLKSPQVKVVGTPKIDLVGREGLKHQISKANNGRMSGKFTESKAEKGESGIIGLSGGNGGSLFVDTENFENSSNLIVDVSGGHGGPGQDGGDGADGLDGREEPAREKVTSRDKKALIKTKKFECQTAGDYAKKIFRTILTYNTKFIFEYSYFEKGQPGGDAGIGGKGGCGGSSGEVKVGGFPLGKIVKENGPMGFDGATGENGNDGENGPEYRGVYVEEKVLSGLRGIQPGDMRTTTERMVAAGTFAEAVRVGQNIIIENATPEVIESGLKAGATVADVGATTVNVGATSADVGVTATKVGVTTTKVAVTATKVGVTAVKVGGTAAKVGVTTAVNVGLTAGTVATSLATSLGICLAVKGVASFICAGLSDEWIEKPHKIL